MVGEENIEFLNAGGRPYIVGTPKSGSCFHKSGVRCAKDWRFSSARVLTAAKKRSCSAAAANASGKSRRCTNGSSGESTTDAPESRAMHAIATAERRDRTPRRPVAWSEHARPGDSPSAFAPTNAARRKPRGRKSKAGARGRVRGAKIGRERPADRRTSVKSRKPRAATFSRL